MTTSISPKFQRVNVEIINTCNLKCTFCPTPERANTKMSAKQFITVAEALKPLTNEVVLHLLGEPLSHPEFSEIIIAAQNIGLPLNIVTNGLLVIGPRVQSMLSPIVRQVSFSLQSFANNFPNQDPKAYLLRLKSFCDLARVERPDLYINLRFWDISDEKPQQTNHNHKLVSANNSVVTLDESQNNKIKDQLRRDVAEIFGFSWSDVVVNLKRRKNHPLGGRLYLHFDSRFVWPSLDNEILQTKGFCHGLTGHFGIHSDGTVVPCCLDHNAEIALGNVFESDVVEILASRRATAMRNGFKNRQLVEDLCKKCGYISRFDRKNRRHDPKDFD